MKSERLQGDKTKVTEKWGQIIRMGERIARGINANKLDEMEAQ
jgi:hypothetical protein